MFQIVERDVPPDIGRRMGGVSLLFVPLKLCGPPTNNNDKINDNDNRTIKSYNKN